MLIKLDLTGDWKRNDCHSSLLIWALLAHASRNKSSSIGTITILLIVWFWFFFQKIPYNDTVFSPASYHGSYGEGDTLTQLKELHTGFIRLTIAYKLSFLHQHINTWKNKLRARLSLNVQNNCHNKVDFLPDASAYLCNRSIGTTEWGSLSNHELSTKMVIKTTEVF